MNTTVAAQTERGGAAEGIAIPGVGATEPLVAYPAGFFDRYSPNTALDMVRQLPGFQLDDGDDQRGFGGAAGNLLINDRYPSAKQDTPSKILARIPASQVERIELIRGQVRKIDLLGRPVVANLILAEDTGAASQWSLEVRKNFILSPLAPNGSISVSDRWRGIAYNVGLDARRASYGDPGVEDLVDGAGVLLERRIEENVATGFNADAYLTLAGNLGATALRLNTTIGREHRRELLNVTNRPQAPNALPDRDFFITGRSNKTFEFGIDAERRLADDLAGKAILLYVHFDQAPVSFQESFDTNDDLTLMREATTDAELTESILRFEFAWTRWANHVVQFNIEGAKNVLDNALVQVVDTGSGPEEIDVPGANSRVEETRADILLNDTWTFGNVKLDYGIGAETSTIAQTGDADQERRFTFLKPRIALIHTPSPDRQTRLSVAREVSQLDFNDFVSATVFQDDDLALGNPNLRPETTWIAELGREWRFGELGVVKVTGFHHWISDVEDLLPLSAEFEAPGNIGDGRRWGVRVETTLPLARIGLRGARVDIKARWQDSTVTDPVTGRERVLSGERIAGSGNIQFLNENRYALLVDFRQDFDAARVSWGWDFGIRGERPLFKVNELDIFNDGRLLNAFIETTRWLGLKFRLSANNILDIVESRDRTLYIGERGLSPVDVRELRSLQNGRRLLLAVSGTF